MASLAMLYLLILEPLLAGKLSDKNFMQKKDGTSSHRDDGQMAKFYLFTPKTQFGTSQSLSLNGGSTFSDFDSFLDTKVIIHGFLDSISIGDWMHDMKDEFLKHGNYNIIVVDWSSGNSIPYSQASVNTEKVGNETARLLVLLRDRFGARTKTFHLIGHSLGSHVAGYVGEIIKPLGRITGLDPAMSHFSNASPRRRLDPSDGIFVDVIHTDGGGIGMVRNVGHVDFYPNGGSDQPGCTPTNYITSLKEKGVVESVRGLICSHMRAPILFMESINGCTMVASQCSSYPDYISGNCVDNNGLVDRKLTPMGYHADTSHRDSQKFYLLTSGSTPFCVFEYRLHMIEATHGLLLMPNLSKKSKVISKETFHVTLFGTKLGASTFILNQMNEFQRFSYVLTSPHELGLIDAALVKWEPENLNVAAHLFPLISGFELVESNIQNSRSVKLCSHFGSLDSENFIVGLRSIYC